MGRYRGFSLSVDQIHRPIGGGTAPATPALPPYAGRRGVFLGTCIATFGCGGTSTAVNPALEQNRKRWWSCNFGIQSR